MKKLSLPVLAAAVLLSTGIGALAQNTGNTAHQQRTTSQSNAGILSEHDIQARLEQQGYTAVGMIKLTGEVYEARANNRDGKSVALEVDAKTGKVLSEGPSPRT